MAQVAYTWENVDKCWCGQCPVQSQSDCAKGKYEEAKDAEEMPPVGELPGLYCATGKATCDDINGVARCYCAECLVWAENGLSANHYCVLGAPGEIRGSE